MEKQPRQVQQLKALRVRQDDWELWGNVAEKLGLTRSAFIKQATANAASLVLSGGSQYFVDGGEATTQNTRINISDPLSLTQGDGNVDACDRSRRDCVAKGATTKGKNNRKPKG